MEWGKVFDLLKTILTSWPLAAVIIVFAVRKSLKTVIENRLFSFKVGNVEIIFDRLLQEVDESLKKVGQSKVEQSSEESKEEFTEVKDENTGKEKTKTPQEIQDEKIAAFNEEQEEDEKMEIIINNDPKRGMQLSFRMIKKQLKRLSREKSFIGLNPQNPRSYIYALLEHNIIKAELASAIEGLYNLLELSFDLNDKTVFNRIDVHSYYHRCKEVTDELKRIKFIKLG